MTEESKRLRLLWLVPGFPADEEDARLVFLAEDAIAMSRRDVDMGVISPDATMRAIEGVELRSSGQGDRRSWRVLARLASGFSSGLPNPGLRLSAWRHWYRTIKHSRYVQHVAEARKAQIIHSHFAWPEGSAAFPAAAKLDVPLVISLRGVDVLTLPEIGYGNRLVPYYDRMFRKALSRASAITVGSKEGLKHLHALGVAPERVHLVHHGVPTDRFTPGDGSDVRRTLGLAATDIAIMAAGRFSARKAFDDLVRAFADFRRAVRNAKLVLVGDGEHREKLGALARELDCASDVIFAGYVNRREMPQYYRACDVFVLTSLMELFGNVAVEAMSAGKPVITTPMGGAADVIEQGRSGFRVGVRRPDEIKSALERLLEPEARQAMGQAARAAVVDRLSMERRSSALTELYASIIESS